MDIDLTAPDWTLIRSFLAVAETGSLSAAAGRLGQSQPTIGRHVRALEQALAISLFTRAARGLVLTDAGRALLSPAEAMKAAASRFSLTAGGQQVSLRGTVRITASDVSAHHILPQIIAAMRLAEPELQIELVASDASENLLFREADIAVRMYRPNQLDIIARHICDHPMALYAARSLLDRVGRPVTLQSAFTLDFVGFDRSDLILRTMRGLGQTVDRDFFGVRCNAQAVFWELVKAGCGVGGMQVAVGDAEPLVERLRIPLDLPPLPVWLAAPEALRSNPRIRRVWDLLADGLLTRLAPVAQTLDPVQVIG